MYIYLFFRPYKNKQVGLKLNVATRREAKELEAVLTRACRTGNYAGLDPAAQDLCVRMYLNQGWELPPELGGGRIQKAPQRVLTLWEAFKLFLQYPEIKAKCETALKRYECAMVNLAELLGKNAVLKDLWVPDLKWYQTQRLNAGVAPATINIEMSTLSRVFAVMMELQRVEKNPCRLVRRLSTKSGEREVYLSRETVQSIAGLCPVWHQRIIWCAYYTGMRRGEILGLTRRQVDLEKRMIYLEPDDTKEGRRKRVPIHRELVPILEEDIRTPSQANDLVFLVHDSQGGRVPGTASVDNPWPRACNALEEKEILRKPLPRFHDLRHTWRTNERRSGMDYQIAESIMGHWFKGKSVNNRYGYIDDQELIRAIDAMTFDHGETVVLAQSGKKVSKNMNICDQGPAKERRRARVMS
jgi:integrase